jgi:hypothetical protein
MAASQSEAENLTRVATPHERPGESVISTIPRNDDRRRALWRDEFTVVNLASGAILIAYIMAFIGSLQGRWFHPQWTTDDATQQVYPFFDALYPDRFQDDLISEVMRGCLPPLHYWLGYGITLVTRDPIMTGHWMMLIQVALAAFFLFAAVRRWSATAPALLSVLWLFHTRDTMQRLSGGLPRGWTPAIFAAFLYCASAKRHGAALAVILSAILLNPPAAVIVGVAYGGILLWRATCNGGNARGHLVSSLALAPLFFAVALYVVQRPAAVGQMVSFEEAASMPEFQKPEGRFPFLPLTPVQEEMRAFAAQALVSRLNSTDAEWKGIVIPVALVIVASVVCVGLVRRRCAIPIEVGLFALAALCTYTLSRVFAFRLFVPDRHLQIPMVFVWVPALCVGIWRALHVGSSDDSRAVGSLRDTSVRYAWLAVIGFSALGWFVTRGTGIGLRGDANFNYPAWKRGEMYSWIRDNTAPNALIACHPTHCDGVQLFAERRAFVTTETSQPFYPRYNLEMRRRSEISLRAQYAETLPELVSLLEPEGITHFVFRRKDFYREALNHATYFPPLNSVVRELVARPSGTFAFNELPKEMDAVKYPFVVHIDAVSVIVDIPSLASYLRQRGWIAPQSSLSSSVRRHAARRTTVVAQGSSSSSGFSS